MMKKLKKLLLITLVGVFSLLLGVATGNATPAVSAEAQTYYEYNNVEYKDFGNVLNVQEDFELELSGQNYFSNAIDVNTVLSFGFKYTAKLSRQWMGFLTKDFQWNYNYSFALNNGNDEHGVVTVGYGSDYQGKWEDIVCSEPFVLGQKYIMDFGVIELFSDSALRHKEAERFLVEIRRVNEDGSLTLVGSGKRDNTEYESTIANDTRGNAFYFYCDENLFFSVGRFYEPIQNRDEVVYEADTTSRDFYSILDVNAEYTHTAEGDYIINEAVGTNKRMSFGMTFTKQTTARNYVAFNVPYGVNWNGNYSFCYSQNGNITLGYGADHQVWGFYNFGKFETGRKYVFEFGASELYSNAERTEKVAERVSVTVWRMADDASFEEMGTASYDVYEYYDFFPATQRGNCVFMYNVFGTSISCGFFEREYKVVVVNSEGYQTLDISYGEKYDLTAYVTEKEHYTFSGWYYLKGTKRVEIAGSGIWFNDFSETTDGVFTGNVYALYVPDSYIVTYVLANGKNAPSNRMSFAADTSFKLADPTMNDGYLFKGWYADSQYSGEPLTEIGGYSNITVYAKCVRVYTVSFVNGGKVLGEMEAESGVSVELPEKIGDFRVEKFTLNGSEIDGTHKFVSDCTVEVEGSFGEYSISYQLNGGTNHASNPVKYSSGAEVVLEKATKEGAMFDGWYADADYSRKMDTILFGTTGDITVYAKFFVLAPIDSVTLEAGETVRYLPQLVLPEGSVCDIRMYTADKSKEIELSNGKNYYFTEEAEYVLVYGITTRYGERMTKEVRLTVTVKKPIVLNGDYRTSYSEGETLTVLDGYSGEKKATVSVRKDGVEVAATQSILLEKGEYTIVYSAEGVDDLTISFTVTEKEGKESGCKSSVSGLSCLIAALTVFGFALRKKERN